MKSITIAELRQKLATVESSPRNYFKCFGSSDADIDAVLRDLQKLAHPDRFSSESDAVKVEAATIFQRFITLADQCRKPPVEIKTKTHSFVLNRLIGTGDVSDVYLALSNGEQFILKISRIAGADKLLQHEDFVLKELIDLSNSGSSPTTYRFYMPKPVDSFKIKDSNGGIVKRVNVFTHEDGAYTLDQVLAKHPNGLQGEHLAWIYKRLLTILGFIHRNGWVHNAVLPSHILLFPGTHGIQLLDWKSANQSGQVLRSISAKYRDYYPLEVLQKQGTGPATDVFMATKCMILLAGGDPKTERIPDTVPKQVASYFRSALLLRKSMRPRDAWIFMDEFTGMLQDLYGKPKFVHLPMV